MIHDKPVTAARKSFNKLFNTDRVPECSIESMLFLTDDSNNSQGKHEYVTTESMLRANPDNFDTDGNHLAPNGKPSNLTYEQWVQVRTPAFKKWFGDWEKKFRIDTIINQNPIYIARNEVPVAPDIKQYRANALAYAKTLRGTYHNINANVNITVNRQSLKEILQHDYKDAEHLQSVAAIPQIIENAIFITELKNEVTKDGTDFKYFVTGLRIGDTDYTVKAVMTQDQTGTLYYDHKLTKIEKGKLVNLLTALSSTEEKSFPQFKDKRLLQILQDNSSQVIDENGEPKVVYHGTSEIFDTFDRSKLGTSTDASSARLGFFFIDNIDTAISYGTWAIEKNVQKMFTQAEVLGRKGKWDTEALSSQAKEIMLGNDDRDTVIMPLFLNIRNPLWLDAEGDTFNHFDARLAEMDTNGHDGIIVKNLDDNINGNAVANHFVAFSRNQIKSATNNRGTFANENPNILFQPTFKDAVDSQIDAITEQSIGLLNKTLRISERTPVIFRTLGFPDLPVEMYVDKLARGLFLDKAYSHGHADGLTKDAVKQVVHHFADPWLVFNSTHGEGNLVAVYYVFDKNEDPIMISLRANVLHNRSIEINLLTSIYGRPEQQIQNWVDRGLLLYRDDQTKSSTRLRLQLPSVGAVLRSDASIKRILYKSQLVNSGLNEVQQ